MKRKWTYILLALGLTLLLACGTALAEEELVPAVRVNEGTLLNVALVPESASEIIVPSDWMCNLYVENEDELTQAYGPEYAWGVELVSGPDMEAYINEYNALMFGLQPDSTAQDIIYKVTCDWGGHTGAVQIVFRPIELNRDQTPTGDTLTDSVYVTALEQTLTITGDFVPNDGSGWKVPGREDNNYFSLWENDYTHQDPNDYNIEDIDINTVAFTSDKPGVYVFNGFISRGSVRGGRDVCILVPGDDSPVHISVYPTDVLTYEQNFVCAAAPGAERMRLYGYSREFFETGNLADIEPWVEWDGERIWANDGNGYAGEWVYAASALIDGQWTDPVDCTASVRFSAPYGQLDEPDAWASMATGVDYDLPINFNYTENALDYGYWYLLEDGGEGLGGNGFTADENTEFPVELRLPTSELQPGALYRIMMDVNAPGYNQGHKESLFIIVGNADERITLTAPESLQAGECFELRVDAPGAEDVLIYTSYDGEHWSHDDGGYNEENGFSIGADANFFEEEGTIWVWAAAYYDGSWNHVTDCIAIPVSAPEGRVDSPAFSLSNTTVRRGDFVKATLGPVSQDAYQYRVFFWNENGEWCGDFGRGNAGDIYIPTANLPAGTYTVHGYVRALDYLNGESEQDLTFTVTDPDDYWGGLYILNPNLNTGEKLVWSMYAKGADQLNLCITDDPARVNLPEENHWEERGGDWAYAEEWEYLSFNNPGDLYAYIGAHFCNEDSGEEWWDYVSDLADFAPVVLHVSAPNGSLPSPDASMPDKAYLGDTITVHFNHTDNAETYSYWVHPDDSYDFVIGDSRAEDGDLVIDTNDLWGSGVYWVELDVNAPGYQEGHGCLHVAVLDRDDMDFSTENIYFTVGATDIQTREDVHIIAYVPGAEAVRIDEYDDWGEERGGPGMDKWVSWGGPQEVPLSVAACFDGEWTDPVYMCTINVTAPDGVLDAPDFSMPTVVAPGEDVVITFNEIPNAITYWYWYSLEDDGTYLGGQSRSLEDGPIEFPLELRIPAEELEPGRTYRVRLDVNHPGWAEGHAEQVFVVTNPDSQQVSLTINNKTTNRNIRVNNMFRVKVSAEGASEVAFFDGWEWTWEEGDSATWSWYGGAAVPVKFYAQAVYPDGHVEFSNIINVNYTSIGDCGVSDISVEDAAYGSDITVTIGEAENAAWYDMHIVPVDNLNEDEQVYWHRYTEPGTVSISTVDNCLMPGSYYVYITTAGPGYNWNSEWWQVGPQDKNLFTVIEGQAFFQADKTEVQVMEPIHVEVYDPEATRIRFTSGYEWWENEEGDDTGWEIENGRWATDFSWDCAPDNVVIKAEGWHGDGWVEIGSADIAITAPNGQIGEPNVIVGRYQNIYYGLWFEVEQPENAAGYDVEVWETVSEDGDRVWVYNNERHLQDEWFWVNPDYLELGHTYTVFVRALGCGYECNEVSYDVTMAEPQPQPEFTVSPDTVQQGGFFHVTVTNYDPDTNYHVYFRGGNIEDLQDISVNCDGADFYVSTGALEPDQYRLCVDVYDKEGWANNGAEYDVTVTPGDGEAVFVLGTDYTLIGVDVYAYVYAPGADEVYIALRQNGEIIDDYKHDGEIYDGTVWTWAEGEFAVDAEARYGTEWRGVGETKYLTVTNSGALDDMTAYLPKIVMDGEGYSFHMDPVDGADFYMLWVYDNTADEQICDFNLVDSLNDSGDYTIQPDWLFDGKSLQAGHIYNISIAAIKFGYLWSGMDSNVAIVDPDSVITLNLPAALTEIEEEAFSGLNAQMVVINAGGNVNIDGRAFADSSVIAVEIPENVAFEGDGGCVVVER